MKSKYGYCLCADWHEKDEPHDFRPLWKHMTFDGKYVEHESLDEAIQEVTNHVDQYDEEYYRFIDSGPIDVAISDGDTTKIYCVEFTSSFHGTYLEAKRG